MKKLGVLISVIGWIVIFLVVSTDDYYTMELRVYHDMNWAALLLALTAALLGIGLYRLGEYLEEVDRYRDFTRKGGNAK